MPVIELLQPYLSINNFDTINVPDFTVITGVNGSGKTHLLKGIRDGHVKYSNFNKGDARYITWSDLDIADVGYFDSANVRSELINLNERIKEVLRTTHVVSTLEQIAKSHGFSTTYVSRPILVAGMSLADVSKECTSGANPEAVFQEIAGAINSGNQKVLNGYGENPRRSIQSLSRQMSKPIIALTEEDLLTSTVAYWGDNEIFRHQFDRLFVVYRDLYVSNRLALLGKQEGLPGPEPLTPDEFRSQYGEMPWVFVNQTLEAAGLDFRINHPDLNGQTAFRPRLTKISTKSEVNFSDLSSGERILLSFAFSVYYSSDQRQELEKPKLLLLDEVDAPLHPSMCRSLVNTIRDVLVKSQGMATILATHSPSTVALSDDLSVYLMDAAAGGLKKVSKGEALNVLTVGVPTLAITFEGRRQVFVESEFDAKVYDTLYKILKPRLQSERSLEFIGTGIKKSVGDVHTGCDVVEHLVASLTESGNRSTYGLIDWDGEHSATQRIKVLAENRRDGIENVILDPLLIATLIYKIFPEHVETLGLPENVTYTGFITADDECKQSAVSAICRKVFGADDVVEMDAAYLYGGSLKVDQRWCLTDDHLVEGLINSAFPCLDAISKKQSGRLTPYMATRILPDCPAHMPIDVEVVFKEILNSADY